MTEMMHKYMYYHNVQYMCKIQVAMPKSAIAVDLTIEFVSYNLANPCMIVGNLLTNTVLVHNGSIHLYYLQP
jgi:methyltransferase-like protein